MSKHIKKLSQITSTTGVGLFLIFGLSGCNNDDCNNKFPQSQIDECKKHYSSGSSNSFIPVSSGGYSANKSSGFFGESSNGVFSSGG